MLGKFLSGLKKFKSETDFKYFEKLAYEGNADDQFNLGNCYAFAHGVELNHDKAQEWWEKAAAQGHVDAKHNLVILNKLKEKALKNKTPIHQYTVPVLTENGVMLESFSTEELLEDIRAHKQQVASKTLHNNFAINNEINKDELKRGICIKCGEFKVAALGRCQKCNFAPESSLDAAKSVFLTTEHLPNDALINISRDIKEKGIGDISFAGNVIEDTVRAIEDRKSGRAIRSLLDMNILANKNQGASFVENILGWRHMQGQSAPRDYRKAFEFWASSAKGGNAEAQYNLGMMYAQGCVVKQNHKQAIELLTEAAEQGLPIAQEVLGMLYMVGNGVVQDTTKGTTWLTKAAEQGSIEAKNLLKEIRESDLPLRIGDRVFHETFGYGDIIDINDHRINVNFDQVGKKLIMDTFIKLVDG